MRLYVSASSSSWESNGRRVHHELLHATIHLTRSVPCCKLMTHWPVSSTRNIPVNVSCISGNGLSLYQQSPVADKTCFIFVTGCRYEMQAAIGPRCFFTGARACCYEISLYIKRGKVSVRTYFRTSVTVGVASSVANVLTMRMTS